jgi:glucose-1-phosphate adenylyltransferase
MATIRVSKAEAPRFGIIGYRDDYRVTSFIEKPANPPSDQANMGVYLFNTSVLDRVLWEDRQRSGSSHDFGKDILPRLIADSHNVYAYPYSGYWVDVGTVISYWQAHMDLLGPKPAFDLGDRSWIIHTRTEERPPVRIERGAQVIDSMLTDGTVLAANSLVERSVLSAGVRIEEGAVVRESILLTDTVVKAGAVIEQTITDKRCVIGENAHIGGVIPGYEPKIVMIGKKSVVPAGCTVEPGAVIGTDVTTNDYSSLIVRSDDYIQTKRLAYEV